MTIDKIFAEIQELSLDEKRELLGRLQEEVVAASSEDQDPEWEAAWGEAIQRRREELESGKVKGIPWEEVKLRGRRLLDSLD